MTLEFWNNGCTKSWHLRVWNKYQWQNKELALLAGPTMQMPKLHLFETFLDQYFNKTRLFTFYAVSCTLQPKVLIFIMFSGYSTNHTFQRKCAVRSSKKPPKLDLIGTLTKNTAIYLFFTVEPRMLVFGVFCQTIKKPVVSTTCIHQTSVNISEFKISMFPYGVSMLRF